MGGYQIETMYSATSWRRANKYNWMNEMREGVEIVWFRFGTYVCNGKGEIRNEAFRLWSFEGRTVGGGYRERSDEDENE